MTSLNGIILTWDWFQRSDQHTSSVISAGDVETVIHTVDNVHICSPWGHEHGFRALCFLAAIAMTRFIDLAEVSLRLDNPPAQYLAAFQHSIQNFAQKTFCKLLCRFAVKFSANLWIINVFWMYICKGLEFFIILVAVWKPQIWRVWSRRRSGKFVWCLPWKAALLFIQLSGFCISLWREVFTFLSLRFKVSIFRLVKITCSSFPWIRSQQLFCFVRHPARMPESCWPGC